MKKMILGIAIILFGIAIVIGGVGDVSGFFTYIGWAISFIGLIYVIAGYLKSDNNYDILKIYKILQTAADFHGGFFRHAEIGCLLFLPENM